MIPFWYCILAVAFTSPAAWWVGRGRLRAERMLRRAAEADAREGVFAVGRAEVQAKTVAALTNTLAAGTELPPRVGVVLGADHPPLAMTSVMRAEDLGDYAYVTAGEVDDPDAQVLVAGLQQPVVLEPDPDEPYDVEDAEDEPKRPGPPPRIDGGGGGTALVVEVPAPPATDHRHDWAYLGNPSLRPKKPWVPADPRLSRLTRTVVRRLRVRAWLADPRGEIERLARQPVRLAGRITARSSWGWQPGQATALARGPETRPAGRHRPEVVAAARASQSLQRPVRVLRAGWQDLVRSPRPALAVFPSLEEY